MANRATPAVEEIPLLEMFLACGARLETFLENPRLADLARIGIAYVERGRHLWTHHLKQPHEILVSGAGKPPLDVDDLDRSARDRSAILEKVLVADGRGAAVDGIHAHHTGTVAVGDELIKLATVGSRTAQAAAKDLEEALTPLRRELARIEESGHRVFDKETVSHMREAWVCLDNAFDILGICNRATGVAYDPVLAARPGTKSITRMRLLDAPAKPKAVSPGRPRRGRTAKNGVRAEKKKAQATGEESKKLEPAKGELGKVEGERHDNPKPAEVVVLKTGTDGGAAAGKNEAGEKK